jgi:cytochrome c oxidase assembly protein subunit 15
VTDTGSGRGVPRWVLLANLAAQIGIVLTGGLVRLTGSGLGCPTWPQCVPGSYTPVAQQPQGYHKQIEFSNRLLTFVVLVAALAALVVVVRAVRRGQAPRLLLLGAVPLVGVFAQALLGGVTVLTGLSPVTVAAHFLLSMLLIAGSTLLLLRARPELAVSWPVLPRRELRWLGLGIVLVGSVLLMLGTVVTGSGPHSGDADTSRFGLDPKAMSWLHADAVWLFVGLVVTTVVALRLVGAPAAARTRSLWLLGVTLAQGVIGYVQYFAGLPVPVVAAHLLGAALLVVAITALAESVGALSRPVAVRSPADAPVGASAAVLTLPADAATPSGARSEAGTDVEATPSPR